jgi:adenylosuccinate synthase
MPNTVVVGSQWGDEGKAKAIDYLTERSDMIIRYQGGANAGHTVIANNIKFVFHMVPSGIMYPGKVCVVGNGVVFDAEQFLREIDDLSERGFDVEGRLFISDIAHMVLPYHKALDMAMESVKGDMKIGTTGRGIGPAYADKASRCGIRIGDIIDWDNFIAKLSAGFSDKKNLFDSIYRYDYRVTIEEMVELFRPIRARLLPFIQDTGRLIYEAARAKKSLLFEGAQGTFLDIDHGTYPFVTSSNTVAGSASTGSGIGPTMIDHVIGITKAYTTRVGNGPFPTELNNELGELVRCEGQEYGATTGRPRRCGWFDSVMLRKAVQLNGLTRLAITKLDVLNKLDEIKLCTRYRIDGKETEHFPTSLAALARVEPIYESFPGWKSDISGCKKVTDLPSNALKYVTALRHYSYNVPIMIISVGPDRLQTIEVEPV